MPNSPTTSLTSNLSTSRTVAITDPHLLGKAAPVDHLLDAELVLHLLVAELSTPGTVAITDLHLLGEAAPVDHLLDGELVHHLLVADLVRHLVTVAAPLGAEEVEDPPGIEVAALFKNKMTSTVQGYWPTLLRPAFGFGFKSPREFIRPPPRPMF